jgi:antitoxin component HigA of HigAB toxin-antitoxin module
MLAYYYKAQPHLFKDAIEEQLRRLRDERDERDARRAAAEAEKAESPAGATSSMDITLYKRMEEVQRSEKQATLEDIMYASVLEKFLQLGVNMLGSMDLVQENAENLKLLTEGVHSREALDVVKDHVKNVMGPASIAYSNTILKMSKLQAAQVYATSIMFGYFVRRVDKRFQLERSLGLLNEDDTAEAVDRLERLFAQTAEIDVAADPDSVESPTAADADKAPPQEERKEQKERPEKKGVLRNYIESFDQQTLADTARLVSAEGQALVETQSKALFGDVKQLTRQMQEAVGPDVSSLEEVMQRVQEAVEKEKVDIMTVTVATQRRAVLEAIAFGSFLRDVETYVDTEYQLLTPSSSASGGGGMGGAMGGGMGGGSGGGGVGPVSAV